MKKCKMLQAEFHGAMTDQAYAVSTTKSLIISTKKNADDDELDWELVGQIDHWMSFALFFSAMLCNSLALIVFCQKELRSLFWSQLYMVISVVDILRMVAKDVFKVPQFLGSEPPRPS